MNINSRPTARRTRLFISTMAIVLMTLPAVSARAATVNWIGGSGHWNIGRNWDSGAQPAKGDVVNLTQSDTINRVVSYYNTLYTAPADRLSSLTINATGTGTMTLSQTSYAHPLYAINEYIGSSGTGAYIQSRGTNAVTNTLYLGTQLTGSGTYDLSGGAVSADTEIIGATGTGTFTQTGGINTVTNNIYIGPNATANGTYTLSGGTLDVGGNIINGSGRSTLNIDGGTLNVGGGDIGVDNFNLGFATGSSGYFTLAGSQNLTTVQESIGYDGNGLVNQSGGMNTTNGLFVGFRSGSTGNYNLSGGSLTASNIESIGQSGTGTLTQTGGTHIAGVLTLGENMNALGTFNLSGDPATVALDVWSAEIIGERAAGLYAPITGDLIQAGGTFNQDGGTHTVSGSLWLGFKQLSTGVYNLTSGNLSAASEVVGHDGTGIFNQTGGTNTAYDGMVLAMASGSSGTYNLHDGSLSAGSGATFTGIETVGEMGTGIFNQHAGTHDVWQQLLIGSGFEGSGTYNMYGGNLSVGSDLIVGEEAVGSYDPVTGELIEAGGTFSQTGGTVVTGSLFLSFLNNSSGRYNFIGDPDAFPDEVDPLTGLPVAHTRLQADAINIGNGHLSAPGVGEFSQDGGLIFASQLVVGNVENSSGTYDMNSGWLEATGISIGLAGTGEFNQWGGQIMAYGGTVGEFSTGSGTYNMHSGNFVATAITVGDAGTGVLNQSGGDFRASIRIGRRFNALGTVNLSGDTATSKLSSGGDIIGDYATGTYDPKTGALIQAGGTFNQDGGTHIVSVGMVIGKQAGSTGIYNLNSGNLQTDSEIIGQGGTGVFNQTGGVHALILPFVVDPPNNTLTIGTGAAGSSGTYNLTGGSLSVRNAGGTGEIINNDTFNYSGGILTSDIITNNANFHLSSTSNLTVIGNVTNTVTGTVKVQAPMVIWAGAFTNDGAFLSNSADNYFTTDLIVGGTGYLDGSAGANWFVSGDFANNSLQGKLWNTNDASLYLNGAGAQNLYFTGVDLGTGGGGYSNNFAWGEFSLGSGISLKIWDSNNDGNAAFYAGLVSLADGVNMTTLAIDYIFSDYNIYYNPLLAGNTYLDRQTFTLNGRGFLMPSAVPVPAAVWLFGSALGLLGWMKFRKKGSRS